MVGVATVATSVVAVAGLGSRHDDPAVVASAAHLTSAAAASAAYYTAIAGPAAHDVAAGSAAHDAAAGSAAHGTAAVGPAAQRASDVTVIGRVIDAESGRPLPDAHVFLAETTVGGVTTADGRYQLARVPSGAHTIYVSMLGYTPATVDTLLRSGLTYEIDFRLQPTVVEGPPVTVTAERDPAWHRRLAKFERQFVGESPVAEQCEIANPEVLFFDARWWGKLTAQAREPLVITNPALGYEVTYFLEEFESAGGTIRFDGEPLFEPLPAPDSATAKRWRAARRAAYEGSFRHFMQSLLDDQLEEEGFYVHIRYDLSGGLNSGTRFGFDRERVLHPGPTPEETVFDFDGYIEVLYERERADPEFLRWHYGSAWHSRDEQRSLIKLTDGPTRIDEHGEIIDPYGVTVYGYFAYERIGDLVPKEYRPR